MCVFSILSAHCNGLGLSESGFLECVHRKIALYAMTNLIGFIMFVTGVMKFAEGRHGTALYDTLHWGDSLSVATLDPAACCDARYGKTFWHSEDATLDITQLLKSYCILISKEMMMTCCR